MVQQRIFDASPDAFLFELTGAAKTLLLKEGTDARYGARHLKRAVERLLVQPICSLIATHQVHGGDCILVDWDRTIDRLMFIKQASGIPCAAMKEPTSRSSAARTNVTAKGVISDPAKAPARLSRVS